LRVTVMFFFRLLLVASNVGHHVQYRATCACLWGSAVSLPSTTSFWEWVALSTTITRWSLLRSWFLILKELRNLLPSFMFILSMTRKLVHTRCALSSTIISYHQETVSGQSCNPPDPH